MFLIFIGKSVRIYFAGPNGPECDLPTESDYFTHSGRSRCFITIVKVAKKGDHTMTEQLREIGQRLSSLREIMDVGAGDLCARCDITPEDLAAYEKGEKDFSFSFLYNAAAVLGVDVLDLLSGESPKLSSCCVVRRGQGLDIQRVAAYDYKHLAYTFRNKKAEPFMVTVEARPDSELPEPHTHPGQEFNYIVEGGLTFHLNGTDYILEEGDSVYFDSSLPHFINARGGKPAKFLALVIK